MHACEDFAACGDIGLKCPLGTADSQTERSE